MSEKLLKGVGADVEEFVQQVLAAQRNVSCASLLPLLLGRLSSWRELLRWAQDPRVPDKTAKNTLKQRRRTEGL